MNMKLEKTRIRTGKRSIVRRTLRAIGISLTIIFAVIILLVILAIISPNGRIVLPVKHSLQFDPGRYSHPDNQTSFPSPLNAKGNQIITPDGKPILLRGLMPPDPARLDSKGKFNKKFYTQIHETGANVVRIAVHPDRWVEDPDYLWRHLDPIIGWAGEMGMYVIIDWHYIGNIETGTGDEMPDIEAPARELTMEFWQLVASYFRDTPNVIFEIWNEPAGGISAEIWQQSAIEVIHLIRSQGAEQLVIVGGVDYSRDLSWVLKYPITDSNVAYAAHIYPAHTSSMWNDWFGDASKKVPVVVTEWGFMDENRANAPFYLIGSRDSFGEPFLQYLDIHGIGWVACWYDDEWKPPMYTNGWKELTHYGVFVLEELQKHQRQINE